MRKLFKSSLMFSILVCMSLSLSAIADTADVHSLVRYEQSITPITPDAISPTGDVNGVTLAELRDSHFNLLVPISVKSTLVDRSRLEFQSYRMLSGNLKDKNYIVCTRKLLLSGKLNYPDNMYDTLSGELNHNSLRSTTLPGPVKWFNVTA